MYSGRHPAMTALIATFSAVTDTARWATKPISCFGSSRAASSRAPTRSAVGGTTGRPSVQPCWKQNSMASATSSTLWRFDVSVPGIGTSLRWTPRYHSKVGPASPAASAWPPRRRPLEGPAPGPRRSLDEHRHRARGAERRHDGGVLARPTRDDDHDVHGVGAERDLVGERPVLEPRGVDDGEALSVFPAEALEPYAGALPERAPHVGLGPPGPGERRGVLGPEDDERLAAQVDVVAARGRRGPGQRQAQRLGRRRAVIVDVGGRLCAAEGDAALAGPEAALDVERRPRRLRLVLREAVGKLPAVAERRTVLAPGPGAPHVLEAEPQAAADHRVRPVALSERVRAARDPETPAERPIDDEERRARVGRRLDRVQVEARLGDGADGGDDHREVLGQGAGERRVHRDRLERRDPAAGRERRDDLVPALCQVAQQTRDALLGRRQHGQPVRPALGDGEILEGVGPEHGDGHAPALELRRVVETPRRAGPSVGRSRQRDVGGGGDLVDDRRGMRGARLSPHGDRARAGALDEELGDAPQQHVGVGLGVVEDRYAQASEARPAPRERLDLDGGGAERLRDAQRLHRPRVYGLAATPASAAAATTRAASANASAKAGSTPTSTRRWAKTAARTATPVTRPSVRARNVSPPAAPWWAAGNAAITTAMFGTWKRPSPNPAAQRARATVASGVLASARLKAPSPTASRTSPAIIGACAPRRSASRPASGAAAAVPSGVSMKRRPPAAAERPRTPTR